MIKEDTTIGTEDKCISCGESFTTDLRVERVQGIDLDYRWYIHANRLYKDKKKVLWHLRCLKAYLIKNAETNKKRLEDINTELAILDKYKDEAMLEGLGGMK